jgi:hypothetical protein
MDWVEGIIWRPTATSTTSSHRTKQRRESAPIRRAPKEITVHVGGSFVAERGLRFCMRTSTPEPKKIAETAEATSQPWQVDKAAHISEIVEQLCFTVVLYTEDLRNKSEASFTFVRQRC